MVGGLDLTPELAEFYNFKGDATQFSIAVPYAATGSSFEVRWQIPARGIWAMNDLVYILCSVLGR